MSRVEVVSLRDLYETALLRIGNYLAKQEIEDKEFPFSQFLVLFRNQIYPLYSKYQYKKGYHRVYVTYAIPYVFPEPAPEFISRIVPVSVYGLYIGEFMNFRFLSHTSYLSTKPFTRFVITYRYEKPKLWCGYQGEVEIEGNYKVVLDEANGVVEVVVDSRDILQDLCSAYMLISIGRSRRAVRVPEGIEFDAEAMVTEGEELLRETRDRLIRMSGLDSLNF